MLAKLVYILFELRNPDAAVITERLGHEGELALLVAMDRNTGRMNLRKARISEICTLLVALPCGGTIGIHGISREEEGTAVASGSDYYGMRAESLELTGNEVAGDDTLGLAVDDDEVEHLVARITLYSPGRDLTVKSCICAEKKLLASLASGIESTAYLNSSEGAVGEISAIFTSERNSFRYTLVDDGGTYLGETIDVRLTAAVITSLDGVIEEAVDGVIVVLVILCGVDSSLSGDRVRAARRIADAEDLDIVAKFTESGGG